MFSCCSAYEDGKSMLLFLRYVKYFIVYFGVMQSQRDDDATSIDAFPALKPSLNF
jgi:hypothetical protein